MIESRQINLQHHFRSLFLHAYDAENKPRRKFQNAVWLALYATIEKKNGKTVRLDKAMFLCVVQGKDKTEIDGIKRSLSYNHIHYKTYKNLPGFEGLKVIAVEAEDMNMAMLTMRKLPEPLRLAPKLFKQLRSIFINSSNIKTGVALNIFGRDFALTGKGAGAPDYALYKRCLHEKLETYLQSFAENAGGSNQAKKAVAAGTALTPAESAFP